MVGRMQESAARVEALRWGAAPARVRDLIGYGALVVAPHPDDEVLGCGALIAAVDRRDALDVVVVSDGSRSPPAAAGDPGLAATRRDESLRALAILGVPEENVRFLELPDGQVAAHAARLDAALHDAVTRVSATDVFVPFRFDRHPDHQAVQAAGVRLLRRAGIRLWEYFVYPYWRLLPGGDVRGHLRSGSLYALHAGDAALDAKRSALEAYRSQTTPHAAGTARPVLGPEFLDRMCSTPETFLRYEVVRPGPAVLRGTRWWFELVRRLEPPLKRAMDGLREPGSGGR